MESKAKAFGHPIHPMLIVFPVGLFVTAIVCDVIYFINHSTLLPVVSFVNILGGLIGGVLAAIVGFRDYLAIPIGTRAKHIATLHGSGNLLVLVLFAISWVLRLDTPGYGPGALDFIIALIGIAVAGMTAWLGGELVDRLGVGVDPGANLNASSSLSGQPASMMASQTGSTGAQTFPAGTGTTDVNRIDAIPVTGEVPEEDEP